MKAYVRDTEATGEASVEAQLLTDDGETIPYEFVSKLVTDNGETTGRIGIGRDISARKAYERQVAEQNDRLQHFAEVLSHDLRNPLSVALTNLELFAQRGDEEYYTTARTGLDRMDEMIGDVLTLARGSGSIEYGKYETIGLRQSATNAWELIDSDAATLEIADSLVVDVDASRLQQVLENLFRNSVEHSSTSGRTRFDDTIEHCDAGVTIRVGALPNEDGFYVEDDGPGIPESERAEVFDPGHSTKDDGTGFGLTSVREISDAHDWDVTVTESDDGGARFEFTGVKTPR
jgi:signal transduction histidine kinase